MYSIQSPSFRIKIAVIQKIEGMLNSITDLFEKSFSDLYCSISKCCIENCKTCGILYTRTSFTSIYTGQSFYTIICENQNCKFSYVVYGVECILYGLLYVGETKCSLNYRISGHRFQINNNSFSTSTSINPIIFFVNEIRILAKNINGVGNH